MTVPVYNYSDNLESERLRTRFMNIDDAHAWTGFYKDKEAVELFPRYGDKSDEELARLWIERQLARYANNRLGLQAIIDKKTNEWIGQAGLMIQEVDGLEEVEVGYHVFKKYWGQGYAPEAAKLFLDYGFKNNFADSIISIIDTRNTKSQRVADKNGLTREKQTVWLDLNVYIYRIGKADWK